MLGNIYELIVQIVCRNNFIIHIIFSQLASNSNACNIIDILTKFCVPINIIILFCLVGLVATFTHESSSQQLACKTLVERHATVVNKLNCFASLPVTCSIPDYIIIIIIII